MFLLFLFVNTHRLYLQFSVCMSSCGAHISLSPYPINLKQNPQKLQSRSLQSNCNDKERPLWNLIAVSSQTTEGRPTRSCLLPRDGPAIDDGRDTYCCSCCWWWLELYWVIKSCKEAEDDSTLPFCQLGNSATWRLPYWDDAICGTALQTACGMSLVGPFWREERPELPRWYGSSCSWRPITTL